MTPRRLLLALVAIPVCWVALYIAVYARYTLGSVPRLSPQQQAALLCHARAAAKLKPIAPACEGVKLPAGGPLWLGLYSGGRRIGEVAVEKKGPLQELARLAGAKLASAASSGKGNARLVVHVSVAEGPIISSLPLLFAKALVPGLDGLGVELKGRRRAYLPPQQLLADELMAGYQPFFFMHEFKTGLDLRAAVSRLATQLDVDRDQWRDGAPRYFRFRVQGFTEGSKGRALPVIRGRVPVDVVDRGTATRAVTRAADYVLRQLRPDGRFHYIYFPLHDQHDTSGDYSLPRHAGTTWFLSLAYGQLKMPRYGVAAKRAIDYLVAHAVPPSCRKEKTACVGSEDHADLGSAGLTLVAIAEYTQATQDTRFVPLARRLGEHIMQMQKANGDFCHQYTPKTGEKNCEDILLYYAGEATFALAKLYQITKDERYKRPIERAMDFLVHGKYDFFLGQFFISEDHWTCIAAEAAHEAVAKRSYLEFCRQFAQLNRRVQIGGSGPLRDLRGGFGITPFFMPHNTPVGSRTEANVATYLLSEKWGAPDPQVKDTILSAARYLIDQQHDPQRSLLPTNPDAAAGGLAQTPIRMQVRIDYVQHAAAALARALPLLPRAVVAKTQ